MELRFSLCKIIVLLFLALAPLAGVSAGELPASSIYQLKGKWITAEGKEASLEEEFRGHPVLVTMAFTRCTYTCPLTVKKLKEIDGALANNPNLRILIISFDTKRETPDSMKAFMKEKGLAPGHWQLMAGKSSGVVRELAALLEVNYKEDAKGDFSHSNVITLLDKEGRMIASVKGLSADHASLVQAAKSL